MKTFLSTLGTVLVLIPTLASAATWLLAATGSSSGNTYYIDTESVQISGDSRTFWVKGNYTQRDRFGTLSSRNQYTINCARRELITRWLTTFDDSDNNGRVTFNSGTPTASWAPIAPSSIDDALRDSVCSLK
jgi:hypothetical protein